MPCPLTLGVFHQPASLEDPPVRSVGSAREETGVHERIEDPLAPGIAERPDAAGLFEGQPQSRCMGISPKYGIEYRPDVRVSATEDRHETVLPVTSAGRLSNARAAVPLNLRGLAAV